ncbi:hypothetical protein OPQ81_005053 [Rhizoctonia solani]|nr:hypothetical protein OPQ81_005053 [Rhizoctonia solani]
MSQTAPHSHTQAESQTVHPPHVPLAPGVLMDANRQWFDTQAQNYEGGYEAQVIAQEISQQASAEFLKAFPFDKSQTVVMDFACGTGMISQKLAPHSKRIIGVDISSKSVELYNEHVAKQGVPREEMKAICVDLTERGNTRNDPLDGVEFDVIVCSGAYHHFADIDDMTKVLASYLKPGTGTLIIGDIIASPEAEYVLSLHEHKVVHTSGFNEELIRSAFVDAGGLRDFSFKPAFRMNWYGRDVDLFIAKGVRPNL